MSKGTPVLKRPKSRNEGDIDLDSSLEDEEDISELTSDELIRKFLPILARVNKKLKKMSSAIKAQNAAIKVLNEKVETIENTVAEVTNENEILYRNLNKSNFIITGITEKENESSSTIAESINELLADKVGKEMKLRNAHRKGPKSTSEPRQVKITFLDPRESDFLWKNKKLLGHLTHTTSVKIFIKMSA